MKSAKQKLDEKLGIKDISEIFDQTDIDNILKDSQIEMQKIDDTIKEKNLNLELQKSDAESVMKSSNDSVQINTTIYSMEQNLGEISYLIDKSKQIILSLYQYITKTDFVDPDIIAATAKMLEASRVIINEYIEIYKDKMKMMHSFNMENLKHKNRLELEEYKAQLKQKYAIKDDNEENGKTIDLVPYVQEQVLDIIKRTK